MPQEKVLNCEHSMFNLPVSVLTTVENTVLCVFNVSVLAVMQLWLIYRFIYRFVYSLLR